MPGSCIFLRLELAALAWPSTFIACISIKYFDAILLRTITHRSLFL